MADQGNDKSKEELPPKKLVRPEKPKTSDSGPPAATPEPGLDATMAINLTPEGRGAGGGEKPPATIRIKRAGATPEDAPKETPAEKKKKTARIELPTGEPAKPKGPATVRLRSSSAPTEVGPPPSAEQPFDSTMPLNLTPQGKPATKPEAGPAEPTIDSTMPINLTPAGKPAAKDASAAKKETSRISLEAVMGAPLGGDAAGPKTIRLKRPEGGATKKPGGTPPPAADPSSTEAKQKTSRIELPTQPAADEPPKIAPIAKTRSKEKTPQTIQIKRPGTAKTIKLARREEATAEVDEEEAKAITEEIDLAAVTSPTRKKTIKLKRAGGDAAAADGDETPAEGAQPFAVHRKATGPVVHFGVGYAVVAVLALLTIGVAVYILCAQALGPNYSGTQLSYAPDWSEELPFPGRLYTRDR